ncbi:hypothetical protein [Raineyella fluvialis]|uniref:Uncharacterized protein n=1 Tax=Raineyella fluvialis TaxID=2662261 RepID=A0A5Q2F7X6_9ACTN|nr:hypothetical protein [Raineyella fluvialis]QGF23002.1 hypothetical protein Rai3103_04210 [Raineyella fluvialis]
MTVKLNKRAYDHAKALIRDGKFVADQRDDWSEDAPSTQELSRFLEKEGKLEYAKWFLGTDDDAPSDESKEYYKFPFSDLRKVHRCAVISGESRAGQYDHDDIRDAFKDLLQRIDEQQ